MTYRLPDAFGFRVATTESDPVDDVCLGCVYTRFDSIVMESCWVPQLGCISTIGRTGSPLRYETLVVSHQINHAATITSFKVRLPCSLLANLRKFCVPWPTTSRESILRDDAQHGAKTGGTNFGITSSTAFSHPTSIPLYLFTIKAHEMLFVLVRRRAEVQ